MASTSKKSGEGADTTPVVSGAGSLPTPENETFPLARISPAEVGVDRLALAGAVRANGWGPDTELTKNQVSDAVAQWLKRPATTNTEGV